MGDLVADTGREEGQAEIIPGGPKCAVTGVLRSLPRAGGVLGLRPDIC